LITAHRGKSWHVASQGVCFTRYIYILDEHLLQTTVLNNHPLSFSNHEEFLEYPQVSSMELYLPLITPH
jgi:hypothetical protein